jgi:hypothetical protein
VSARRTGVLLVLAACLVPAAAPGQTPSALLEQGVEAYNDLQFGLASRILQRALDEAGSPPLAAAQREQALMYLGATEVLSERRSEAVETFRILVLANARYRPDELVFPPRVTRAFSEAQRTTKVTALDAPRRQTLVVGSERFPIRLWVSSSHLVSLTIRDRTGTVVRTLHEGTVDDSLVVSWNGLGDSRRALSPGNYTIAAASQVTAGTTIRSVQMPLTLRSEEVGELTAPQPPDESDFLPEKRSAASGLRFLIPAAVIGAVLIIPALSSDAESREVRIAVGGAVTIAGLIGFWTQKPGQPIPENVAHNDSLRSDYRRRLERVESENARRSGVTRFTVFTATPELVEGR